MNGWEAESDAAQLLNGLGVTTDLHYKLMSELNGSEKVKVLLAKALFGNPDILLLDEPMNGLDKHGVKEMRELFKSLAQQGKTIIMANHSAEDIDVLCDTVCEMDLGVLTRVK